MVREEKKGSESVERRRRELRILKACQVFVLLYGYILK